MRTRAGIAVAAIAATIAIGAAISFRADRFFSELLVSADDSDTPRTVVTPWASHSL